MTAFLNLKFFFLSIIALPFVLADNCDLVRCATEDMCPDGKPRSPIGDNCCACEPCKLDDNSKSCKDQCTEFLGQHIDKGELMMCVGKCQRNPCNPPVACLCEENACPFGGGPETIDGECCQCDCAKAGCPRKMCDDGKGPREMYGKCCQCPEDFCHSDDAPPCTKDMCPDGKPRSPIGNNCCACEPCLDDLDDRTLESCKYQCKAILNIGQSIYDMELQRCVRKCGRRPCKKALKETCKNCKEECKDDFKDCVNRMELKCKKDRKKCRDNCKENVC